MNKIKESELNTFIGCKLSDCEYKYHHFDDCTMSGCRGHTAIIKYYSTSESYSFDFGDGTKFSLDGTQIQIIHDYLMKLKS